MFFLLTGAERNDIMTKNVPSAAMEGRRERDQDMAQKITLPNGVRILTEAIDSLLDDIAAGRKYMKVYRQMKMYNDADTNPVLYGKK